jgi:hypothetical protein
MSAANRILGEQNVARMNKEVPPFALLQIQRSTQRNDQLPGGWYARRRHRRKLSPRRRGSSSPLFRSARRRKVDDALLEMRVAVISRRYSYASDHVSSPVMVAAFALDDSGPAMAERGSAGRNGTTVT